MALTRAQLLSGDISNGVILPGQPQGVRPGGAGIIIDTDGIISVDSATITGVVKLNNTGAYNSYVWPAAPIDKKFLQTDGTGLLSWSNPSGFAVVTVQSQPSPTPADVGELWFDCTTGTLNVYQNCVGTPSPNWFNVAQPGLPVLPINSTAVPAFTGGNGTQATPYDCSVTTASSGTSVFVVNVVTISGLAPFQYVPIIDLNSVANGGRFSFTNNYADAVGSLTFETVFIDQPSSPPSTTYTAAIKVGYGTVYIDAVVNVVTPLSTTPGSISGTPQVGSTLTYTQGVASGGVGPYTYTQVWKRDGVTISGATGLTYVLVSADVGTNITVEITATDTTLSVATATTASVGPITTAPFPAPTWNPTPSGGLNNNPGGISGTYTGTGPITSTGCIEASVNGGAYSTGTQTITSGQTLAVRWANTSGCGAAATGTALTGTVTDGVYENTYNLTVNRIPTPPIADISDSSIPLNAVTTKVIASPIAGMNSTAYVTYDILSTGTSISASVDNSTFLALSTSGTGFPITNAQNLYIRQTVGASTNTGYTAIIRVGDGTNTAGTYDEFVYTATTVLTAVFPSTTFAPSAGPTASPANTVLTGPPALNGTATATWADGTTSLTATGSLQFQVNGGGYTQASTAVANGNTVDLRWDPTAAASAADAASLTGTLTNSTYTNTYTLVVDKQPTAYTWTDQTSVTTSSTVTSNVVTIADINCPAELTYTAGATNTLTSVQASIDGGAFTNIPTSSPGLVVNPADAAGTAATTIQLRATVGAGVSTAYTLTTNIGQGAAVVTDEWSVTTAAVTPSITTPSITSPANGATNLNPATNTPAGIPLVSDTYAPLNGAGTPQTSSTWEVYKANPYNPETSVITAAVSPGSAGTILYKTSNTSDAPSATFQNEVYGDGATTAGNDAAHPAFQWASALSIGGFSDWYIPAKNELEILYYNLKPTTDSNSTSSGINPNAVPARASNYTTTVPGQTTATAFQTFGAEAFIPAAFYWSSSENPSNPVTCWSIRWSNGDQSVGGKNNPSVYARAIRRITIADYVAAGSPAIGSSLAGGYYGGQISTTGNSVADYALIVAPNATGTYGYIPGGDTTQVQLTLTNNQDLADMVVGDTLQQDSAYTPVTSVITAAVSPGSAGGIQQRVTPALDTNPNSQNVVYGKLATDQFNDAAHPAFQWAKGLTIGGNSDWYIPAKNELEILYFNLKPETTANDTSSGINPNAVPARASNYTTTVPGQTTATTFQAYGSEAFISDNFWSSSEVNSPSGFGWLQNFSFGGQYGTLGKNNYLYARAIRRITIADYVAAGSPAIGSSLAGGYYGGQISTTGNSVADYALVVAPNATGTYGYIPGGNTTQVQLTLTNATNLSLLAVGGAVTEVGGGADATGTISAINSSSAPFTLTLSASTGTWTPGATVQGPAVQGSGTISAINSAGPTISLTGATSRFVANQGKFGIDTTRFITPPAPTTEPPDVTDYTAVTGSPFTVSAAPFTTNTVPQASLAVSSTYYARVKYATTNVTATTSNYSGWSSFGTSAAFAPNPGTAMAGGYFGGQINDGGTIYNLIVAPLTAGSLNGQNGGSSPSTIQYKTTASADAPTATVQNLVYGGPTTDLFKASAAHPIFSTFINGATGPNAGAFNLATGGAGGGTGIGGFNDWYLPAKNELEILYFNLKPDTNANDTSSGINPNAVPARASNYTAGNPAQTTNTLFQTGGTEAFSTAASYWSSSEDSSNTTFAWKQYFLNGAQSPDLKYSFYYARAVRRISA